MEAEAEARIACHDEDPSRPSGHLQPQRFNECDGIPDEGSDLISTQAELEQRTQGIPEQSHESNSAISDKASSASQMQQLPSSQQIQQSNSPEQPHEANSYSRDKVSSASQAQQFSSSQPIQQAISQADRSLVQPHGLNSDNIDKVSSANQMQPFSSLQPIQQLNLQADNSSAVNETNSARLTEQSESIIVSVDDALDSTGTRESAGLKHCDDKCSTGSCIDLPNACSERSECNVLSSEQSLDLNIEDTSGNLSVDVNCKTVTGSGSMDSIDFETKSHDLSFDPKMSDDMPCDFRIPSDIDSLCEPSKATSEHAGTIKKSPSFSLLHRSHAIPANRARLSPAVQISKSIARAEDDNSEREDCLRGNFDGDCNASGSCAMDLSQSNDEIHGYRTNKQHSLEKRSQVNLTDWVEVQPQMETSDLRPVAVYTDTGAPVLSQDTHKDIAGNEEGGAIRKIKFGISDKALAKPGTSLSVDGDDKPYRCPICMKTFNHLKLHMKVHTGDRPYKCTVCSKAYIEARHLENHMRSHTGEKPFKCDLCEKSFSRDTHLTYHRRTHTGEKPFMCEICEKRFGRKGDLVVHLRIHTGERPFPCSLCDKSCATQSNLTLHLRTHTGEKPYNCEICPKKFKSKSDLIKHTRSHEGMKPYECELCHKKFRSSGDLTRHHRSHTGEKPYKCDVCLKEFSSDYYLPRHACKGSKTKAESKTVLNQE